MKYLLFFCLCIVLGSCKNEKVDYYPEIKEDMSAGMYYKYKGKLDTAYLQDNHFEVGIQLANLKAPITEIFPPFKKGIKEQPEKNCYRVYEWYTLFKEHNFQTNIVKADTLEFIAAYQLCENLLGQQAFIDYQTEKELAYQEHLAQRTPLDSSKFDLALIKELEQIYADDQGIRMELLKKGMTAVKETALWKEQKKLDSLNLIKVEQILQNGFPTKEMVGYGNVSTIWLVLHHQSDYLVRQKYLPIIEKAVQDGILGEGQLKTYKWRDELIRLDQKDKP